MRKNEIISAISASSKFSENMSSFSVTNTELILCFSVSVEENKNKLNAMLYALCTMHIQQ